MCMCWFDTRVCVFGWTHGYMYVLVGHTGMCIWWLGTQANIGRWRFCNYNDSGIGFPRDCGKSGFVAYQWNSLTRGGHGVTWKIWRATDETEWVSVDEDSGAGDWQLAEGDLLERDCPTCAEGHKTIVYKRLTDGGGIDFKNLFLHQVTACL